MSSTVTFMDAMEASKNGKVVRFYDKEGFYNSVFKYNYPINENGIELYSFEDLIEGTWVILD
ncbi:hypothetical protein AN161_18315 [Lysinibacillus sp. FJAT-14222]|nr:hypothetical protein AN161_18315 [Lysinibacillus sp. FJAT-14222]